jgi:ADP-heptose:LPS heptosyltransferase
LPLKQSLKHLAFTAIAAGHRAIRPVPPPLSELHGFLLLQYPAWLGSAVHATPIMPALRAAVPGAEIVVCASGFALDILRHNPGIDRLIETPNPTQQLLSAARAIRAAPPLSGPFATITTSHSERSTIALAAMLAGATNFVGFTQIPELYRNSLRYDSTTSRIDNNLRIVGALDHPPSAHFEPQVFFSPDELAYARGLTARFDDPARTTVALVTQTSRTQRKSWRPERFVAAAQALIESHGANILLLGSSSERPFTDELAKAIGTHARSVAGETNLTQLAALLSLCAVGLTLDTGIMHVGRAVGLPMVIIAPAWSPPLEWLPLGDPRFIILKNLDLPAAPPDYIIDEVSVDEVVASLDRLLAADFKHPL